jgi:hypothetical protein
LNENKNKSVSFRTVTVSCNIEIDNAVIHYIIKINKQFHVCPLGQMSYCHQYIMASATHVVRDSSAVQRLLWICCSCARGTSERYAYGKQRICFSNSGSAHFHVSWLSDFIFYQKPLYKLLHQSFFYSFITILPSESGATLHYSTILP